VSSGLHDYHAPPAEGVDIKRYCPCLSVRLSVSLSEPDPKCRVEGHRKLKISRNEAHDTGDK